MLCYVMLYQLSIADFLQNIPAKNYKNPTMHTRVIAKNVGDPFYGTRCIQRSALEALARMRHI